MKSIFLKEADIINGISREAGELVIVEDDYPTDNIRVVIRPKIEVFLKTEQENKTNKIKDKKDKGKDKDKDKDKVKDKNGR